MLFLYELKKILLMPAVIGIVILCIIVNTVIITVGYDNYHLDKEIKPVNIFEDLQTKDIAEAYIKKHNVTSQNAENIRKIYDKLQPVVEQKAKDGDALSPYFGKQTPHRHSLLFGILFMAIIAESCLLALFTALISVTYENIHSTESIIYTSKIGRDILKTKLFISLAASVIMTALIIGFSLLIFVLRFDFSGVWYDNVSSMFNYAVDQHGKPFITWQSFTVVEYLLATVGVTFGLVICFCLLGYVVGVFVRNGYGAFLVTTIICGITFLAKMLFPIGSISRCVWNLTPVWLWKNSGMWFTDGGADIIWANYEIMGIIASFVSLCLILLIAIRFFARRNLL